MNGHLVSLRPHALHRPPMLPQIAVGARAWRRTSGQFPGEWVTVLSRDGGRYRVKNGAGKTFSVIRTDLVAEPQATS